MKQLKNLTVFLSGVGAQHYLGKRLDQQENFKESLLNLIRNQKLDSILKGVE
jgi:hypothetical protein